MNVHTIKVAILILLSLGLSGVAYLLFKDFYQTWRLPFTSAEGLELKVPLLLATYFLIFDSLVLIVELFGGGRRSN